LDYAGAQQLIESGSISQELEKIGGDGNPINTIDQSSGFSMDDIARDVSTF